jgi:hypothetical protein
MKPKEPQRVGRGTRPQPNGGDRDVRWRRFGDAWSKSGLDTLMKSKYRTEQRRALS